MFTPYFYRARDGWLFYLGNEQGAHLAAYLQHGYLNISLNMLSTSYSRASLQLATRVDDGIWNSLSVKRSESRVDVNMNGNLYLMKYTIPGKTQCFLGFYTC